MTYSIIRSVLLSFALTLAIEILVGLLMRARSLHDVILIVLVNVITNPLLNILLDVLYFKADVCLIHTVLVAGEIGAVVVEWLLYRGRLKCKTNPLLFSIVLNLSSFTGGLIINVLFKK